MPTFYARLLEYQKSPTSVKFSRKKTKSLAWILKSIYDKKNPLPQYVESIEDGQSYQVRNYPDSFTKTIDDLIKRVGENTAKNADYIRLNTSEKLPEPPPERPKKERKKIPAKKKPIYSTRP